LEVDVFPQGVADPNPGKLLADEGYGQKQGAVLNEAQDI
jgi:hypothetical protein